MNRWQITRAADRLRHAGVVLHATEGVWGLACDPFLASAVDRVLGMKQRPMAKGLIVIGGCETDFAAELAAVPEAQRRQIRASWPGPVTWLLPNVRFPGWVTGGRDTVAVRVSGHPQARALCRTFGGPLVSTSANPSGRPPALTALKARAYFPRGVDYVLPGEVLEPGQPSSIRTLCGSLLRGRA